VPVNNEEIRRALAQSPVLAGLDPNALQFLTRFGTIRRFAAGDALMRQGEPSVSIHFVLSGGVEVVRQRREDERPVKLAELGVGEVVGEMGVLINSPRSATVLATAPTETLELDAPSFERVGKAFPILHRVLATLLSERLRRTSAELSGRRAADS
jgi:CRP-like cAMP-binding protein